jgi:hypothetical protein
MGVRYLDDLFRHLIEDATEVELPDRQRVIFKSSDASVNVSASDDSANDATIVDFTVDPDPVIADPTVSTNELAGDVAIVGGSPVTDLVAVTHTPTTNRVLVLVSMAGRAVSATGAWENARVQLTQDGTAIAGCGIAGYPSDVALTLMSSAIVKVVNVSPGTPVDFGVDVDVIEASPAGYEIYASTRPLSDHCHIIVYDLPLVNVS